MNNPMNTFFSNLQQSHHPDKDALYDLAYQVFNDNEYNFTSSLQKTNEGSLYLVISGAISLNNNKQAHVRLEFQQTLKQQIFVYLVNPDKTQYLLNSAYTQSNANVNVESYKLNYPANLDFMEMLKYFKQSFNTTFPYVVKPKPKDQIQETVTQNLQYISKEMRKDIKDQLLVQKSLFQCYQDSEQEYHQLQRLKQDIERQSFVLIECTTNQEDFLKEQQENPISSENIEDVIVSTQDSFQVAELSIQLKVYKDAYKYLARYINSRYIQTKFIENQGEYEWMYQNVKKLADKECDSLLLLQKCLKKW